MKPKLKSGGALRSDVPEKKNILPIEMGSQPPGKESEKCISVGKLVETERTFSDTNYCRKRRSQKPELTSLWFAFFYSHMRSFSLAWNLGTNKKT
ncbi:CLUMA_CG016864, isoform A [Clunio marinus]|uniref:CLUMA_CG016864, isoform A n=1 Tax=Clunio marinus TaxID=568069 RepID=A0A1J1IVU4_9DIPT|nr:CLUMA_CG016864, isoform A [Clunio marinus]